MSAFSLRFQESFSCDVGANLCFTGLDLLPFTVTFLMSFWQVQYGIMGGVATSGALLLYNVARPQIKVRGEVFFRFIILMSVVALITTDNRKWLQTNGPVKYEPLISSK